MNLMKAEIKTLLLREYHEKAHGLGSDAEDTVIRFKGALEALKLAAKALEANKKYYHGALKAADDSKDKITPEQYEEIRVVIDRDIGSMHALMTKYEIEIQRMEGQVQAYKRMAELMEKEHKGEIDKVEGIQKAYENGNLEFEDGIRPDQLNSAVRDIEERRKQAAAERTEKQKTHGGSNEPKPDSPKEPEPKPEPMKVKEKLPEKIPQSASKRTQQPAKAPPPGARKRKRG